jgi:hypothetical protein
MRCLFLAMKMARRSAQAVSSSSVLLVVCFLCGCSRNDGEPVRGFAFRVEGTAVVSDRPETNRSRPLSAGAQFSAGEEIRVPAEGSAALCLTPGIYLRCFGPARVQIDNLRVSKDGDEMRNAMNSRLAAIRLNEGRIHAFLPALGSARTKLQIQTEAGTILANPGALFLVARKPESIRVLCVHGEVSWIDPPASSTPIEAGYYCERKLREEGATDALPASEDATAQGEVAAILDSANYLDEIESATRNAPAPWRKN